MTLTDQSAYLPIPVENLPGPVAKLAAEWHDVETRHKAAERRRLENEGGALSNDPNLVAASKADKLLHADAVRAGKHPDDVGTPNVAALLTERKAIRQDLAALSTARRTVAIDFYNALLEHMSEARKLVDGTLVKAQTSLAKAEEALEAAQDEARAAKHAAAFLDELEDEGRPPRTLAI